MATDVAGRPGEGGHDGLAAREWKLSLLSLLSSQLMAAGVERAASGRPCLGGTAGMAAAAQV